MIGVTLSSHATEKQRRECRRALEQHGARVVELPPQADAETGGLDGLLLSGGGDMHPRYYGECPRAELRDVDCARDERELALTGAALAAGMPLLGICRGAQVLGVALGGGLIQDILSEMPGALAHRTEDKGQTAWHWVEIAGDSRLSAIMGAGRVNVNSSHHQANGPLGEDARAVAWAEDGVVEAIDGAAHEFVLGVQWHPERMLDDDAQRRLFEVFVAAAREHAGRGQNRGGGR